MDYDGWTMGQFAVGSQLAGHDAEAPGDASPMMRRTVDAWHPIAGGPRFNRVYTYMYKHIHMYIYMLLESTYNISTERAFRKVRS